MSKTPHIYQTGNDRSLYQFFCVSLDSSHLQKPSINFKIGEKSEKLFDIHSSTPHQSINRVSVKFTSSAVSSNGYSNAVHDLVCNLISNIVLLRHSVGMCAFKLSSSASSLFALFNTKRYSNINRFMCAFVEKD